MNVQENAAGRKINYLATRTVLTLQLEVNVSEILTLLGLAVTLTRRRFVKVRATANFVCWLQCGILVAMSQVRVCRMEPA
jgi:hypothetical protein